MKAKWNVLVAGEVGKKKKRYKKEEEMENTEIVEVEQGVNGISVSRNPQVVLNEARKAAQALISVVSQKKKPVIFNGEQYLEFEDWMTVARFYGLSVKVSKTAFVDFGGVKGYEAVADVIRNTDGMIISSADGMCLNDEPNWSTRPKFEFINGQRKKTEEIPVPLFQLRSMAQTRACSKALRNVLAWVVVLGGFKPTPAEEMLGNEVIPHKPEVKMPEAVKTEVAKEGAKNDTDSIDIEQRKELNVIEALEQPVGIIIDVWGILFDCKDTKSTKKDKNGNEIYYTDYQLSPRDGTQLIKIRKFGKAHAGISIGDTILFRKVEVQEYNNTKKFLAQEIEVLKKVEVTPEATDEQPTE